ncbi:MAG TPA: porin family protein [Chitinophagaceae bacterium]|nr:porin family protein [Chitinophagaceae bacterium]
MAGIEQDALSLFLSPIMQYSTRAILLLSFTLICLSALAQNKFAIYAGPQMTSAKYKVEEIKQPTSFRKGLQLGASLKVPFENNLYFGPAVYYSLKGYDVTLHHPSFPPTELAVNNSTTLHTLEIAPMLHYDFSMQPSHFFIKLGPAIDVAFKGQETFQTIEGETVTRDMIFSFGDYGRVTSQAILQFGYETPRFLVFAHYAEGLGGLNNADGGPTIKHRIAGLSLGWFLYRRVNADR